MDEEVPMMDGFSFYVVDVEQRNLLVMDPAETSIHDDEMSVKHEVNANLVLRGLRRCSRTHLADQYCPDSRAEDGWSVTYAYSMNEPCDEYNGVYLERHLVEYELAYLKKQFAYKVISMKGGQGEFPSFMIEEVQQQGSRPARKKTRKPSSLIWLFPARMKRIRRGEQQEQGSNLQEKDGRVF